MDSEDYTNFEKNYVPFIRTGIALLLYLIKNLGIESCYVTADKFTTELKQNLK